MVVDVQVNPYWLKIEQKELGSFLSLRKHQNKKMPSRLIAIFESGEIIPICSIVRQKMGKEDRDTARDIVGRSYYVRLKTKEEADARRKRKGNSRYKWEETTGL